MDLNDDDDDDEPGFNMGDLTFTPMYTYVYNYRPPPRDDAGDELTLAMGPPGDCNSWAVVMMLVSWCNSWTVVMMLVSWW